MAPPAQTVKPAPKQAEPLVDRIIEYKPFGSDTPIRLSIAMVVRYLCRPTAKGKVCTEDQALRFLMLCQARQLNPWEGDAFLVGYDTQDGPEFNLVTAHQAFLKRAEGHPMYDGMDSGVLVARKLPTAEGQPPAFEVVELEGDFYNGDDQLVGGWAKVYRKDRSRPTYRRLKLATFNKGFSRWKVDPAGMIVKCAEADALRSTFPNTLAAMYFEGEFGEALPRSTAADRVAGIKAPRPAAIADGAAPPASLVIPGEIPEPAPEPVDQVEPPAAEAPAGKLFDEDKAKQKAAVDATK